MKISVGLATYNGEKYLKGQLDSIANQTYLPDELVVIDDASSDSTVEIIKKFSMSAPFNVILKVNLKNLGYTENFNEVLSLTTGDLVFLSDQDDYWFPEKIENISKLSMLSPDIMLFMNDAYISDENLNHFGETVLGQVKKITGNERKFVAGCCIAVRRQMLDMCLPVEKNYPGHDGWLVRFADAIDARKIIEKPLQIYRRHASTVSSKLVAGAQISTLKLLISKLWSLREFIIKYNINSMDENINSSKSFLDRLYILNKNYSGVFSSKIKSAINELELDVIILLARRELRNKSFFVRFRLVVIYWIRGYYKRFSGVFSMLRDFRG